MKNALLLMVLVALIPSALHAADGYAWQLPALLAVLASFSVLVIFYLFTYLVDSPQMRPIVTGEMFQVFITLVMIAAFVGAEGFSGEVLAPAFGEAFGAEPGMNQLDYAIAITQSVADWEWATMLELDDKVVAPLGALSSTSGNCAFFGFSYTYNGCAGIGVPFSSMNIAVRVFSTALMAVYSQLLLLSLAGDFFFPILLPIGLFLRAFHVTRGAGGLLISVAVAFYFIYPLGVIITKGLFDSALVEDPTLGGDIPIPTFVSPSEGSGLWDVPGDCNPFDMDFGYTRNAINRVIDPELVDRLLYHFFVGGLLNTGLNLLIALTSVKALSRIFGTEVDVSALARVA